MKKKIKEYNLNLPSNFYKTLVKLKEADVFTEMMYNFLIDYQIENISNFANLTRR